MLSKRTLLIMGVLFILACRALSLPFEHRTVDNRSTDSVTSPQLSLTQTSSPFPTATTIETETPVATPSQPLSVIFHPDNGLYVGDQVSMEVIASPGHNLQDSTLQVIVQTPISITLPTVKFAPFGIGKRFEANLIWAWDTKGLQPGDYLLDFSIQPYGPNWTETVSLLPAEDIPSDEKGAHWTFDESDCCLVYYITQTAAERDMDQLLESLDEQAEIISQRMQAEFTKPITVAFIPRVLGHGGFTSSEISVSYLDRNYTGESTEMILRHELAHGLDNQLGGDLRPTLLIEGLAVYASGGHFKPEPLLPRAAVLLDNHGYIPLAELTDDFYEMQHEISYLEASALVQYLVDTYGWQDFSSFYRDIHPAPHDERQSAALDIALKKHFDLSLDELEQQFKEVLGGQEIPPEAFTDLNLTVDYYDTVRRYQQMLDPSAYFLNAWILDGKEMRQRGITADYLRHPNSIIHLALETMLQEAGEDLSQSVYGEAKDLVLAVNQVLDAVEQGEADPFLASPLARDYYTVVRNITELGFQPQRIQKQGNRIELMATHLGQSLHDFVFVWEGNAWKLNEE